MENTKKVYDYKPELKAEILEDCLSIPISSTQMLRVLLVRDEHLGIRVSAQKWWRETRDGEWVPGKGFMMTGRQALKMGKALQDVGKRIINVK
ncbi:hypothetical protein [Bacillus phage CP-51]|uniref:Uncharacterized protein n=1 Tax=Bacillus phage CP-51 TaxID=1391188 RepID=A0A068EQ90_9CAUD|nr:hypothetical protein OZ73_gp072 [Bacillus phage CP-51]AID50507.1 hypothetical protein [Bacillus phage CP-51]